MQRKGDERTLLRRPITDELLEDYEAMGTPIMTEEEFNSKGGFLLVPHNPEIHKALLKELGD